MSVRNFFSSILIFFLRIICPPRNNVSIPSNPKSILIIRQHNQFGDMLATIPLFRAVKEKYPDCDITLMASPENYFAVKKNKYIDYVFNFDKKQLLDTDYIKDFFYVLRKGYDLVIVPVTVSVSSTSSIIARLAKAAYRIGPKSLEGKENKLSFLFDEQVDLDWGKDPNLNVSQFIFDIVKPVGITTNDYSSHVTFDTADSEKADEFIYEAGFASGFPLVGFHIGAGKPPNRWPVEKFIELITRLESDFHIEYFFTGSSSDKSEIDIMKKHFGNTAGYFLNKTIPELAAVISRCALFISNDTGVMHVAGAVNVPQISIFGPTDPVNWAPIGKDKLYIRKGIDINSVSVDDVYIIAEKFLNKKANNK